MEHTCDKSDRIKDLENEVKSLNEYKNGDEAWRLRFEAKLDKMLWSLIWLCVVIIGGVLGGLLTYVLSKI